MDFSRPTIVFVLSQCNISSCLIYQLLLSCVLVLASVRIEKRSKTCCSSPPPPYGGTWRQFGEVLPFKHPNATADTHHFDIWVVGGCRPWQLKRPCGAAMRDTVAATHCSKKAPLGWFRVKALNTQATCANMREREREMWGGGTTMNGKFRADSVINSTHAFLHPTQSSNVFSNQQGWGAAYHLVCISTHLPPTGEKHSNKCASRRRCTCTSLFSCKCLSFAARAYRPKTGRGNCSPACSRCFSTLDSSEVPTLHIQAEGPHLDVVWFHANVLYLLRVLQSNKNLSKVCPLKSFFTWKLNNADSHFQFILTNAKKA